MVQTDKHPQFNDFSFQRIFARQAVKRIIDFKQSIISGFCRDVELLERDALLTSTVAQTALATRVLNQNPPHRFGCGRKKVGTVLERGRVILANEAHPGFMDQRSGLKGLIGRLVPHFVSGQLAQFLVYQRQ